MAFALKEQGNEYFKAGQYKEAEDFYSQAISVRSNDPKLFQNRALSRIRLSDWRGTEQDSRKAVELDGKSMKAHYYLAQALLNLRHVGEAHKEALKAYSICLATKDSSAEVVGQFVLRAKQAVWQAKETARLREMNETLAVVETMLDKQLERDLAYVEQRYEWHEIGEMGRGEEIEQLKKEADERRRNIRAAFARSDNPDTQERVVPDWMIDPITFEVMHDPVITPSGVSYERVVLLQHLKQSNLDPLTREKLTESQLVSNVGLKYACSEFLERNGWAVDW
ncbi:hypothetical protein OHC33_001556 [Knufia fluminis]|uniref:E3 ubiquitin-protein ligase CHIP n=1 Tax=Knufia fluminis TaxID=191047 RepID=A0AAN8IBJ7_9EURO|nr:hypothetical protein OHC33_001556 [Knufia fluminis]